MSPFAVAELAVPTAPVTDPSWAVQGWARVDRAALTAVLGHDDFASSPTAALAGYAHQTHTASTVLLAVAASAAPPDGAPVPSTDAGGDPAAVLGYVQVDLPLSDNQHLAVVELAVHPRHRGRGVGTALWRAAEDRVRAAGRTVVVSWSVHADDATDDDALPAPTGAGRLSHRDPAVRFALRRQFRLEQTERHSTLSLPVTDLDERCRQARAAAGPDYRLVQWTDRTPEQWVAASAELQRRMSVDVPVAGLDLREETWTADRVRDRDAHLARRGYRYVLSAVEHLPSGTLVAFTELMLPQDRPEVALQENTLVHGEHRGRRLGLWVKAANLQLLAREQPAARRVHTWNAGENRHMLAINDQLGFVPASVEGSWQRRLEA